MTSSTSANQNSNRQPPPLTDFSIDSIIGNLSGSSSPASLGPLPAQRARNQASPAATDDGSNPTQNRQKVKKFRPKNFPCPACKMAFSNNGQLKNHLRIHTGERPFRCNQPDCNKTFTRNEELTRHKLIHTGVRPHTCNCCGKQFGRKDHLKKHVKTHDRKRFKKRLFLCRTAASQPSPLPANLCPRLLPPSPPSKNSLDDDDLDIDIMQHSKLTGPESLLPPAPQLQHQPPTGIGIGSNHRHQQANATANVRNQLPPSLFQFPNSIMAATSDAIQQLASDYWTRWYNLMGICPQDPNQQQQHQLDLFRQGKL